MFLVEVQEVGMLPPVPAAPHSPCQQQALPVIATEVRVCGRFARSDNERLEVGGRQGVRACHGETT